MPNTSFAGYEGLITIAGATVAVAERVEFDITQDLEEVPAIGDFKPQDLKEVMQHVGFRISRAYFKDASAADFFNKSVRDANGYLTSFSMTVRMRDLSTGSPVDQTITATGCKMSKYTKEIPAGRGIVVERIEGQALNATRA